MRINTKTIILFLVISLTGCGFFKSDAYDLVKVIQHRPSEQKLIFDYAGILEDLEEYCNRYLKGIRDDFTIEALIVSVPSLEKYGRIEDMAVEIFQNWEIGKKFGGRGILLLFVDDVKQVKLEIAGELEDVFTDAFSGYAEDLQLRPNFLSGRLDIGMIAVMEEMENRAQIKHRSGYSSDSIAKLDMEFLSQGAGAKRNLLKFEREVISEVGAQYPAGKTADEAWQIMIQSWRNKARDPNLGVYTEMTKLSYRDYRNLPDSHYEKEIRTYAGKPYEVIQNDKYAVIFFGNKKGWDNSPFLLARAGEGWKFDIVHQRKFVRMGRAPAWGIERGDYPYIDLLSQCPYFMGQDIPLKTDNVYQIKDDTRLAKQILQLESKYKNDSGDFEIAMKLGKLYVITAFNRKAIPILKKAKQLNVNSALPYKYLAIAYVGSTYQYKAAINELKEYVKRVPEEAFGRNYLGYCYYKENKFHEAIEEFKKAIHLQPDNGYAYCKLSRSYAMLHENAGELDPRKIMHKNHSLEMLKQAQSVPTPNKLRLRWLKNWLRKKDILE